MFDNFKPLHTKVEKVISVRLGEIILEQHSRYPLAESNLYCLAKNKNGEILWYAERPTADSHYIRVRLNEDGVTLSAYTTGQHACELDLETGKLISHIGFR